MKRLTGRYDNGVIFIDYHKNKESAMHRLADIEDILCDDTDEYDLDRLAAVYNQRMSMRDEVSERFSLTKDIPLGRLRELVEVYDTLREFAEDVARQFGYHGTTPDGKPAYTTGGLSTLEWAWSLLGWPDPKPAPECECQEEGCHEWASGGRPTPDGYKWLCSRHFAAYEAREEAEAALKAREQDG